MKSRLGLMLGLLCLMGCARTPQTLPPPATLQALTLYHPPALRWMAPLMADCAQKIPGLALYRLEVIQPKEVQAGEMLLWWGNPPAGEFVYQIGQDALQVIVHPDRAGVSFSGDELAALFGGQQAARWSDGTPMQLWVYAAEDPLWQVFAAAMQISAPATDAFLAPDPQAMLDAVVADPDAIGFVPRRWIAGDQGVSSVQLTGKLATLLRQPVTVSSFGMPQGFELSWLSCVQSSQP